MTLKNEEEKGSNALKYIDCEKHLLDTIYPYLTGISREDLKLSEEDRKRFIKLLKQEEKNKIIYLNYTKKENAIKEIEEERTNALKDKETENILKELNINQEIKEK